MLGRIARGSMAVGRVASAVFGLALVVGLTAGAASAAFGANGGTFVLGKGNVATALTSLAADAQGAALRLQNTDAGADDTALSLAVGQGEAPMRVNSDGKVANLNADKLDGGDSSAFVRQQGIYRTFGFGQGDGAGDLVAGSAACDSGDTLLGGGMDGNLFGEDELLSSGPGGFGTWFVRARDNGARDSFTIAAICADFPPLRQ